MGISGVTVKEIEHKEAINIDLTHKARESGAKRRDLLHGIKRLFGKVITVDEDWIFESKDWPYLYKKK